MKEVFGELLVEVRDFDSTFDGFSANGRVESVLCKIIEHLR